MAFFPPATPEMGDRVAVEDDRGTFTYRDLTTYVSGSSKALRESGVGIGTVVGVAGNLDRNLIAALHAVWGAGGVVAPFHPGWTPPEARTAASTVGPELVLLGEGASPETVAAVSAEVPSVLTFSEALGEAEIGTEAQAPEDFAGDQEPLTLDSPAARLLTSGTAGTPKVVELTVRNLRASAHGARQRLSLDETNRWLASLSVAHVGGLALVTRAGLLGSRLFIGGPFDAARLAGLIQEGRVSHASLVPTMVRRLLDEWGESPPPTSLRCLLVGGAGTPGDLLNEALARGFPLALTYGLSEASSQVATAPPDLVRRKPGTVGPPLPGTEVRIGSGGSILVRGDTVVPGQADDAGWLDTGDLGRLDDDGHLWVVGRSTNRIISGGVTIDPGEVEAVLLQHPSVEGAVVVGIEDPEWGEKVVAAVAAPDPEPDLAGALEVLVRAHLSPGKRPRAFCVVDALPLNPNGKIDGRRIREWFDKA